MKHLYPFLLCISMVIVAISCKPEDTAEPNTDNHNPAQHNQLIKTSRVFGNTKERTEFEYLINTMDGHCYYHLPQTTNDVVMEIVVGSNFMPTQSTSSVNQTNDEVGKVRYDGTKLWGKYAGMNVKGMTNLTAVTSNLSDALIVSGTNKYAACISIFSNTGQFLNNKTVTKTNHSLWFNNIKVSESTTSYSYLVAVGGMVDTINNLSYPYLVKFRLDHVTNAISIVSEQSFTNFAGYRFSSIECFIENGIQNFIATTNNYAQVNVCKLNANLGITWKKEINYTPDSCWSYYWNKITVEGSKIYICGSRRDNAKGSGSTGGTWRSGMCICLDINGNMVWETKIVSSKYAENASQLLKIGNLLFVIGNQSAYYNYDNKMQLQYNRSNASITKIDALNGQILNTYTFGEKNAASGFTNAILIANNQLLLGGYTNFVAKSNIWQGWLVGLNLSDM